MGHASILTTPTPPTRHATLEKRYFPDHVVESSTSSPHTPLCPLSGALGRYGRLALVEHFSLVEHFGLVVRLRRACRIPGVESLLQRFDLACLNCPALTLSRRFEPRVPCILAKELSEGFRVSCEDLSDFLGCARRCDDIPFRRCDRSVDRNKCILSDA